jgi:glutamine synthetase
MYELNDAELAKRGVTVLPRNLLEAIEAFDRDPLSEEVFGPELKASFVALKRQEWEDYHNSISQWEIDRYLTMF